jgi:hypothetical protein
VRYDAGVDRTALQGKFERLAGLRGDPTKGIAATDWAEALEGVDQDVLIRAGIVVVRELLVPEWADRRKADNRPQQALDAAEAWLKDKKSADTLKAAKAAAKACTAAKNETFGDAHRVAEAARSIAYACGAENAQHVFAALTSVEAELLARIALMSEYHRGPEMRRAILDILKRFVLPPEPAKTAPAAAPAGSEGPVPYSPEGHFKLGQRLVHKKFAEVVVSAVGETWVEVELADGTKKRLAHAG